MLELFCFNCHTSDDVGGCHRCEIGRANLMMLKYLEDNLKPNKDLKKLLKFAEEDDFFLRLRSHFRPKKASRKYIEKVKKNLGKSDMKFMIPIWARNSQECDRILTLLEKLKTAKTIYDHYEMKSKKMRCKK